MSRDDETDTKTIVDRSIQVTLPASTYSTPSVLAGCTPQLERLHRLHGTSLLAHATFLLRSSPSTFPTACTIFHRFYHRCSLQQYDVWSACLGITMLACKIEEDMRPAHDVILIFIQIYRRLRLGLHLDYDYDDDNESMEPNPIGFIPSRSDLLHQQHNGKRLTHEEKCNILRYIKPLLKDGPVYTEWREKLESMENIILRELGFTLFWIPSSHPHNFLLYFIRVLEIEEEKIIGQISWSYCNDSYRIDLSVRYEPEIIACASILLAALHQNISLPSSPRPWWQVFLGSDREIDLSIICNALLALRKHGQKPIKQALRMYIVSLSGNSFVDPSSFIWSQYD